MNNENLCEIVVGAGVTTNSGNSGSYGETFYVWTNAKTVEELQSAYLAGVEKTGVDVQKDCEGFISLEDFQKIENIALDGDLSPGADNLLAHKVEMTAPLEAFDDQPSAVIEGEPVKVKLRRFATPSPKKTYWLLFKPRPTDEEWSDRYICQLLKATPELKEAV